MDLRNTLRYLGIPIRNKSHTFGDNDIIVTGSTTPHVKIHKRRVALSFHRIREYIASEIITYHFIRGMINPADILSKHWRHAKFCTALKPFLLWQGDTIDCLEDGDKS